MRNWRSSTTCRWCRFCSAGVADNWDLMQADGMHPMAEAEPKVLENVWKVLEGVLTQEKG